MESSLTRRLLVLLGASIALAVSAQPVYDDDASTGSGGSGPGDDDLDDDDRNARRFTARLHPLNEVPSISTNGRGWFRAELDEAASMITYTLTYENLESPVAQAHIHLGQMHTNGGVSAFLCSNLDDSPPDVQPCPDGTAEVTGTIMAEQVVGPADQGISEGEFEELLAAMRAHSTYANVHTEAFPAGEIRGQVRPSDDDDDDFDDDDR